MSSFIIFFILATAYFVFLPFNEEVLLLVTLSIMFYTLYSKLPFLITDYFDKQNDELLRTYRFALEVQKKQLKEALSLFQSEIVFLKELDSYADWSLLRLNLLLQLRQEKNLDLVGQYLVPKLFSIDQDRKVLARSYVEFSYAFWRRAFTDRLQKQDLSAPTLFFVSSPHPTYPFLIQFRVFFLTRRGS